MRQPPSSEWPLWRVLIATFVGYSVIAALLYLLATAPPLIAPRPAVAGLAVALVLLAVAATLWSWKTRQWWPRLAASAMFSLLFLAMSLTSWFAVLRGVWLWVVVIAIVAAYLLAWALPAVSIPLSTLLWREQSSPQTPAGRAVLKWALFVGLGGAGVIGASVGTSLVRTGQANVAYLFVALGGAAVAVFSAQGVSHQLWPDRPWARQPDPMEKRGVS